MPEKRIKNLSFFWQLVSAALVLALLFFQTPEMAPASASTLNPGTDFNVCAHFAFQPFYLNDANPTVTVHWTFTSPYLQIVPANTQVSYQVQIDDDPAFGSINVDSGTVANAAARSYTYTGASLSFGAKYYWRLLITDNNSSVTDWISGDSFTTNKPSILLKGLKLRGGVRLK